MARATTRLTVVRAIFRDVSLELKSFKSLLRRTINISKFRRLGELLESRKISNFEHFWHTFTKDGKWLIHPNKFIMNVEAKGKKCGWQRCRNSIWWNWLRYLSYAVTWTFGTTFIHLEVGNFLSNEFSQYLVETWYIWIYRLFKAAQSLILKCWSIVIQPTLNFFRPDPSTLPKFLEEDGVWVALTLNMINLLKII